MCPQLPLAPYHTGVVETEADRLIRPVDHLLGVESYHRQGVGKLFWKGTDSTYFSFRGCTVPKETAQLCHCSIERTIDKRSKKMSMAMSQ